MRDYKNVKVPKKYRTHRVTVEHDAPRRPKRKPVPLGRVLAITAIIALCVSGVVGYQWASRTEMFLIAGVDVKGVRQLSDDDLKSLAGFFTGQNIFRVNLEAAARQARAHPWVKDVRIHRNLPNRISMVFTERAPVVVLETGSGRYLVDSEGVVIDRAGRENMEPLPRVLIADCKVRPGEPPSAGAMSEALTLLAELQARGGWQLADVAVKAASAESLSILFAEQEFKIGCGNYPEKLRRLAEIMDDMKTRSLVISYVDLRPDRQAAAMVKNTVVKGHGSGGKGQATKDKGKRRT